MLEVVKDWWGLILALSAYALGGAWWIGRLQKDIEDLKNGKFVSNESCSERRGQIERTTTIRFTAGDTQFAEIKSGILRLERSHAKLIETLLEERRPK